MKPNALILGGTGGIGFACAKILAENKFNLIIIHKDSRSKMGEAENKFNVLRSLGSDLHTINMNAVDSKAYNSLKDYLCGKNLKINVFVHALSDANVGNLFSGDRKLTASELIYTFNSMSASFVAYSQFLMENGFMQSGGRILGFTSMGSTRVLKEYAAVGIAKASLEAACRYMAIELAPEKITVNLINAGLVDTPALNAFADAKAWIDRMQEVNPAGRLTTAEDVAKAVLFLISESAARITGEIIRVDGGEQLI